MSIGLDRPTISISNPWKLAADIPPGPQSPQVGKHLSCPSFRPEWPIRAALKRCCNNPLHSSRLRAVHQQLWCDCHGQLGHPHMSPASSVSVLLSKVHQNNWIFFNDPRRRPLNVFRVAFQGHRHAIHYSNFFFRFKFKIFLKKCHQIGR